MNKKKIFIANPFLAIELYLFPLNLTSYVFLTFLPLAIGVILLFFGMTDRSLVSGYKNTRTQRNS
jgi:hypothetical protein